jgi:hypothetical protein
MNGSELECGALVHNLQTADPKTDVRTCPVYLSQQLSEAVEPDEWVVIATVDFDLGVRCLKWATKKGHECQLRNWPIEDNTV